MVKEPEGTTEFSMIWCLDGQEGSVYTPPPVGYTRDRCYNTPPPGYEMWYYGLQKFCLVFFHKSRPQYFSVYSLRTYFIEKRSENFWSFFFKNFGRISNQKLTFSEKFSIFFIEHNDPLKISMGYIVLAINMLLARCRNLGVHKPSRREFQIIFNVDFHEELKQSERFYDYVDGYKESILMSADEIRSFNGLEHLTDEEAEEASETLFFLSVLIYKEN